MNDRRKGDGQPQAGFNILYFLLALLAVFLVQDLLDDGPSRVEEISYSRFQQAVEAGEVTDLAIGQHEIRGRWTSPQPDAPDSFVTNRVEPDIAQELAARGVEFRGTPDATWIAAILSWVIPAAVLVGLWWFLIRRMTAGGGMGGMMNIGRSRAKIYVEQDTGTTFADVAGADEAKAELEELVDFLKDPDSHGVLGARAPKGVLLLGPPGTGKTLLARAVAGEAGVPFFSISGSEFVEMFVGVGAARVRDLFEQARQKAPAIIFIDELDALGRARGVNTGFSGHDEREQTLNQLLTELDGFDPSVGVVLLAATNRPEILDPALLRAGRFDRQILIDRPDKTGRAEILRVHMKKVRVSPEVEAEDVAALTTGFTGADLANLVNEAALVATRRGAEAVEMEDFTRAIERIIAGLEKKKRLMNPREREFVSTHESGHALVALALPGADPVHKVSIIPRGVGALGYTIQRPAEDRYLSTAAELENRIAVLLAGRAAERLVHGHYSTGAADDLARATDMAHAMVARYGMDDSLGHAAYESGKPNLLGVPDERRAGQPQPSEAVQARIDAAVAAILDRAFARAAAILRANRDILERMAQELLARETLEAADLARLTEGLRRPQDAGEDGSSEAAEHAPGDAAPTSDQRKAAP